MSAPSDRAEGTSAAETASLHSLMSLAFPDGVQPQQMPAPSDGGVADPARQMTPQPARPAPSPTRARAMSDSWAQSSYMHSFQQSPTTSSAPQPQSFQLSAPQPPHHQPPGTFGYDQPGPETYGAPPPMPPMVVGPQNSPQGPPVRLFQTAHRVSMARYATSSDPRGYIPVLEYSIGPHHIMIDSETGAVHFTGIWKALGHAKADVNRLIESDVSIAPLVRKIRGGFLKIQGTWLPYETALVLARRVAFPIRAHLVPLFGPTFVDTCLMPDQPGYGSLVLSQPKSRARSRAASRPPLEPSSDGSTGPIRTQQSWERFRPKWSRPPPQGAVAAPYLREGVELGYDTQPYVHRPPTPPPQQPQHHHYPSQYSEPSQHAYGYGADPNMFGFALYPPEQSMSVGQPGSTPVQLAPLQGNILPPHLQHAQPSLVRSGEMPDPEQFQWSMPGDPAAQALLQMSINTPTTSWTPPVSAQYGRHADPPQLPTLESLAAQHAPHVSQPRTVDPAPAPMSGQGVAPSSETDRGQLKMFSSSTLRTPTRQGPLSPRFHDLPPSSPFRSLVCAGVADAAQSSSP